jgi:hypothetical protein
VVRR